MKVLFITSTRIGDAVLSTALLSHLSKTYPEAKFTVACGPLAAPLFSATPNVVRVIALQKRRASLHWFGLWQACCGTWWDLVVDLRASAISYFLMTRRRMVWRRDDRAVHRVNSLAELAGLSETPVPHLSTGTQHRDAADKLLGAARPVLVLGPTANWPGKQWQAERFVELARRLTAPDGILPGARIAILGAASERDDAAPVVAALPADRVIDLVGKLDLLTAAALLERSDMYIGNDSGLMHIAAAAGVPTLGLFGPSKEAHYAPWGARTAVVRTALDYDELVGGPGYDHRTTGSLMESLSVDMAADAARRLWAEGT
jgi:ADP-heptose:LPS heptosyltransferase